MANPKPKTEYLRPIQRMDDTQEPLAALALSARVAVHIDAIVRQHPNRSAWLRRVITEAAQRELINQREIDGTNH
jgi:hypothetical protein